MQVAKATKNAEAAKQLQGEIAELGNLVDFNPVGEGIYELGIDYGPGYRIYFAQRGKEIILLLIGGNKSSQQRDIKKAIEINVQYERE